MIDRVELNRALSKAIAYANCGKRAQANLWAAKLVMMLECHNVLTDAAIADVQEDKE